MLIQAALRESLEWTWAVFFAAQGRELELKGHGMKLGGSFNEIRVYLRLG
jgi:hypothetical protein